jgi:hypothetical protein
LAVSKKENLKKKIISVKDLKKMKDNAKKHPAWQIERLVFSISTYSNKEPYLLQPLVVDEKNTVLIGNGRLEAIQQLQWSKVEVIVKEGLSEDQKKALSILDNKSISTEWNDDILAKDLPMLSEKAIETGFTEKEIKDLLTKMSKVDLPQDEEMTYDLTPQLYEKYDYILLFFDNEIDFLNASQLVGLKKMRDRMKNQKVGLYRAVKGNDAIALIKKNSKI